MAIRLDNKPTNLTIYPNSFERQEPVPLDANSLFFKLTDAETYAKTNPVAYVGQIITVIDKDNKIVTHYSIEDESGTLKQLTTTLYVDTAISQKSQVQIITSDTSEVLSTLKIHKLTQDEYDQKLADGTLEDNVLYLTPEEEIDLTLYATIEMLNYGYYTKTVIDNRYYTKTEIDDKIANAITNALNSEY